MLETVKQYMYLMRLNKPIGILLLLWPTLWAVWLASDGHPSPVIFSVFVVGVILMRSAGCVINDVADRRFDPYVARTRERPLASGKVSLVGSVVLFAVLCLVSFALVIIFLNNYSIELAVVGAVLAIVYPYLKRVTSLPQLGLGLAFSWGIPMAFAAIQNHIPSAAWLLFMLAAIWSVIYDTMYAMTDRADDLVIGVKSTAILFDHYDKWIMAFLQMIFLMGMAEVGKLFHLKMPYYASLFIVAWFFTYQLFLIKDRDPGLSFKAFLNNNWVGFIIFLGIVWSFVV